MLFNIIELSPDKVKVKLIVQKVGYKLKKPFKTMLSWPPWLRHKIKTKWDNAENFENLIENFTEKFLYGVVESKLKSYICTGSIYVNG